MRTNNKARDNPNETETLEELYSTPKSGLTTARLRANLGGFGINLSVVGPVPKHPEGYFPLDQAKANYILETISNLVKSLDEELRC